MAVSLLVPSAEGLSTGPEGDNRCSAHPWQAGEDREPLPSQIPCTSSQGDAPPLRGVRAGYSLQSFPSSGEVDDFL